MTSINSYSAQSGRMLAEDGSYVNIADVLGGTDTGMTANIEQYAPQSGRFIAEDGTVVNIAESIRCGTGSINEAGSAPPIVEKASGKQITTTISADRPLKGLRLYATCKQNTTTGAQLLDKTMLTGEYGVLSFHSVYVGDGDFTLSSDCPIVSSSANLFFLSGQTEDTPSTSENGVGASLTRTVSSVDGYVTIAIFTGRDVNPNNPIDYNIMLNAGSAALLYEPYTGGKPSPSANYPQEIQEISSMFDVNVSDGQGKSQTMTIPVQQQGFWGIPVSSGGNYTDADG